jgi:hypothetical protein
MAKDKEVNIAVTYNIFIKIPERLSEIPSQNVTINLTLKFSSASDKRPKMDYWYLQQGRSLPVAPGLAQKY